jgi:hypothetical protein
VPVKRGAGNSQVCAGLRQLRAKLANLGPAEDLGLSPEGPGASPRPLVAWRGRPRPPEALRRVLRRARLERHRGARGGARLGLEE